MIIGLTLKILKGIWRRTSLEKYLNKEGDWETVLDIDKLSKKENQPYVYHGCTTLNSTYNRCILSLSIGGKDATIKREFDLESKTFIEGEKAFYYSEAKGHVVWLNENQLFVTTDFGEGSMNSSGYPRIVKLWSRGTKLTDAIKVLKLIPISFSPKFSLLSLMISATFPSNLFW
ncbi:MAG: hypothetical protein U0T83_01025 [Bacteriovoracaceae bacterium]